MTDGIERLAALRKDMAARGKVPEVKIATKAEMREMTMAADARKARDVVKREAWHSLPELAAAIMVVVAEAALKHRLGAALEELAEANAEYRKIEILPAGMVAWVGGHGLSNGLLPPMPENAPDHKKRFAKAWNTLLMTVNEITKTGVQKRNRSWPITLLVDVDLTEPDRVQVQGFNGDGW